jgi:hypothetical protein
MIGNDLAHKGPVAIPMAPTSVHGISLRRPRRMPWRSTVTVGRWVTSCHTLMPRAIT